MNPENSHQLLPAPRASRKTGLAPGSLVYVGDRRIEQPLLTLTRFSKSQLEVFQGESAEARLEPGKRGWINWFDLRGLHEVETLKAMGERFKLHPLLVEDILHTMQRPKIDIQDDVLFFIVRRFALDGNTQNGDQISVVMGKGFVLTFQEGESDAFTSVRKRLKQQARVRFQDVDYLSYALVDTVVDEYFEVLEKMGEEVDEIQEGLVENPTRRILNQIHQANRRIIDIRRAVRPLKDAVQQLERDTPRIIREETKPFIRDLRDHIVQVAESAELFRETLAGLLNTYLAGAGMRTNEAMRVLAVISTTFIPLSFIAGLYGMNFKHMPELEWRWAYPAILVLMGGIAGSLIYYFRKRKWF